jgi:hypothetical protein
MRPTLIQHAITLREQMRSDDRNMPNAAEAKSLIGIHKQAILYCPDASICLLSKAELEEYREIAGSAVPHPH